MLWGSTGSTDFPGVMTTDTYNGGARDAVHAVLDASNLVLQSSSYLGGGQYDDANAISTTGTCGALIAGRTGSSTLSLGSGVSELNPGSGSLDGFLVYSPAVGCQ